jgi:hypothetical protein
MGALFQDRLADRTVGRNTTLTSTLLKLGGGRAYYRSSDQAAVVT